MLGARLFGRDPRVVRAPARLFIAPAHGLGIAPDRTDAVRVNDLDVLVGRAEQCARERGRTPNYLAVNFFDIGDVVAATDVLNDVDG